MEQNPYLVFLCLIVWLTGVKLTWKSRIKEKTLSKYNILLAFLAVVFLCLFAFYDTDYFHYLDIFNSVSLGYIFHIEEIYLPIAMFANGSYFLFRLYIWGFAVLLAFITFRRFELPVSLAILFFLCLVVLKFGYGRVSLALAMATFGYSCIVKPFNPKLISILLGGVFVYYSAFFHTSAIFYIFLLTISFIATNAGKKTILMMFIMYAIVVYLFQRYGGAYILQYVENDESTQGALSYLNGDFRGYEGVGVLVKQLLDRMPFFLTLIIAILIRWKGLHKSMPYYMKSVTNLCIYSVLAALVFSFETTVNTYSLYYRFLYFSMLPTVILICYCHLKNIFPKLVNITFWCGFIASVYNLVYSFYCTIVG